MSEIPPDVKQIQDAIKTAHLIKISSQQITQRYEPDHMWGQNGNNTENSIA
jgi:hypothetical protein